MSTEKAKKSSKKEETKEQEIKYFKGKINTHEKAAPELVPYENGTLRMTGSLVYRNGQEWDTVNFIAYNANAEKINTAISLEQRTFTLSGELKQGNLYVRDVKMHQLQSIEGTINFVEKQKNGDHKLLVGVKNERDMTFTFYATVPEGKELNGSTLEKGQLIAINGEGTVFDKKDDSRAIDIRAWNVAKNAEELEKIIELKREASKEKTVA